MSLLEIKQALKVMVTPGDVVELRIFDQNDKKFCGWFNDIDNMAEAALSHDDTAEGTYYTCNACVSDMLAIANNRIIPCKTASSEKNMLRRRIIGVDIDPRRNPVKISSTDEEHSLAIEKAREIKEYLKRQGWNDPVIGDSGNGAHLDYFVDLPVTEEIKTIYKKFFVFLKSKFSNDRVDVQGFEDANRVWKLYGTMVRKGENLPNRPHRKSSIIEIPKKRVLITHDMIKAIADNAPQDEEQKSPSVQPTIKKGAWNPEQLTEWLKSYNILIARTKTKGEKTYFVLKTCVFNPDHTGSKEAAVQIDTNGVIGYKCHHDSCKGKKWTDVRELFEPGYKDGYKENGNGKSYSQATDLIRYTTSPDVVLFHDEKKEPYARLKIDGTNRIVPLGGREFRRWLTQMFFADTGTAPGSDALTSALGVIEAKACFHGKEYELFNRVAWHDGAIWYDLGAGDAVKISVGCWDVVKDAPILFRRHTHMKAHDTRRIKQEGDVKKILDFVNLQSEKDRLLFLVYLVSCFVPEIPHPIPVLYGDKGSSKTTVLKMVKEIVDPSILAIISFPHNNTELVQKLYHHYMAPFDNIADLSEGQSDALCRACTGEGVSKRALFTNEEDVIFNYRRCVALNGINLVADKPDLLDRAILLRMDRISKEKRKTEDKLWRDFYEVKGEVLGGIFNTLAKAASIKPNIILDELPRMADFAVWGCAISEALGTGSEAFMEAYLENIQSQNKEAIDASPIGDVILKFVEDGFIAKKEGILDVEKEDKWKGTASELLSLLEGCAAYYKINIKRKEWPKAPNVLTRRINEIKTNLADEGIGFDVMRDETVRTLKLYRVQGNIVSTVIPSGTQSIEDVKPDDITKPNRQDTVRNSLTDDTCKPNDDTPTNIQSYKKQDEAVHADGHDGHDDTSPYIVGEGIDLAVRILKENYDSMERPENRKDLERLKKSITTRLIFEEIDDGIISKVIEDYCTVRGWE